MNLIAPSGVVEICGALRSVGFEAWIVGGAVRDLMLGREPHDWDIATNAQPHQVATLFRRVIETGIAHGTMTVISHDRPYEVTTYRADGDYSDGRRPDSVRFVATIEEDLNRRDFTVNAMALDPVSGKVMDPFGGQDDLRRGLIRATGNPVDRFSEDSLRMMRAVRFAATLGFQIDANTMDAIRVGALSVAAERIHDELSKGIMSDDPQWFIELLNQSSLLGSIVPEMLPMFGCVQNKYHEFDVWQHTLEVVKATPHESRLHLRLAALFHDIAKPSVKGAHPVTGETTFYNHEEVGADMTDEIMRRLKFSNEDRERVVHLVRHHLVPQLPSSASVRRWVRKVGRENVADVLALARADTIGKGSPRVVGTSADNLDNLEKRIAELEIREPIIMNSTQLAINGVDVMEALGIGPGPDVGQKLRELMDRVTDDPSVNTREGLLRLMGRNEPCN